MEYNEKDYEYDYEYDYNDEYPQEGNNNNNNTVKGLKIAFGILLVALIAISVVYFQQVRQQKQEFQIEKDTLQSRLSLILDEMGDLRIENDTINAELLQQRFMADSLMDKLQKERSWNRSKIRQYENELTTLRTAMKGFVRQIDSLNQVNQALAQENIGYKRRMASYEQRALAAEETASELGNMVKRGSQIRVRDVMLHAFDKKKTTNKAKNVQRFVTEFVLAANDLAELGERTVYVRIITPDNEVMGSPDRGTFTFNGESIYYSAKRPVDYQGEDLPVSVYYDVTGLYGGQYTVMVYVDGMMVGSNDIVLK